MLQNVNKHMFVRKNRNESCWNIYTSHFAYTLSLNTDIHDVQKGHACTLHFKCPVLSVNCPHYCQMGISKKSKIKRTQCTQVCFACIFSICSAAELRKRTCHGKCGAALQFGRRLQTFLTFRCCAVLSNPAARRATLYAGTRIWRW